jgi:hypothetical protein
VRKPNPGINGPTTAKPTPSNQIENHSAICVGSTLSNMPAAASVTARSRSRRCGDADIMISAKSV